MFQHPSCHIVCLEAVRVTGGSNAEIQIFHSFLLVLRLEINTFLLAANSVVVDRCARVYLKMDFRWCIVHGSLLHAPFNLRFGQCFRLYFVEQVVAVPVVSSDNGATFTLLSDAPVAVSDGSAVSTDYECTLSSIWSAEFPLSQDMTRLQTFRKMFPVCEVLVVAFNETRYHISGDEPSESKFVQVTALCRLKGSVAKATAQKAVATALSDVDL